MNVCTFSISLLNKYAHVDWFPVDGEAPPRILHFNPRLKGDWTGRPIVEQNTCYRMQWGSAQRCDGSESRPEDETGMYAC